MWCGVLYSHIMQLYFVSFQSPVNICSLQSPRLIETSIMDFRFHNYPLLSSLTLYSRNQNCNNYFHHVKQKYIKQNTSRYFYSSSSNPPGWLVADCGGGSGIYQICGGTGFSVQSSTAHLDMSCHVLSCHQLHPVTSFHMTSTITASGSRWCLPSISRYECSYTVMLIQSGRVSHYNWVID